jgi:hypothetical protein
MGPGDRVTPPRTPAIAFLQRHRDDGRFVAFEFALPPAQSIRFGLADVRGYDPPFPTERFFALWRMASPDQIPWEPTRIDSFTPTAIQMTGALGARYILAGDGASVPRIRDPALRALRTVYDGHDATIFENPRATPRAFVARELYPVSTAANARAAVVESGFDARRVVVVELDQPAASQLAGADGATGTARIVEEQNAKITIHAGLDRRGVVVLGDQLLDGWSVRVDGRLAKPLFVDSVMRGVVVDPGHHEIVWSYRVPGLRAGVAVSALSFALLLVAAAYARVRRRRVRR